VPFLDADGFRIMGDIDKATGVPIYGWTLPLPHWAVVALQFGAFGIRCSCCAGSS
jgi:hypothetical protein